MFKHLGLTLAVFVLVVSQLLVASQGGASPVEAAGTAAQLAFTTQPGSATGGTSFGTQPQVTVEDSSGNAIVDDSSTVTLTLNPPGSGGPGTLSGCSQSENSGVVSFSGCAIDTVGSGYTLTATVGQLTATSNAFDVTVGPVAQVAFTQQPTSIQAGVKFNPALQLSLEDAGGNLVTSPSEAYSFGLGVLAGTTTSSGATTATGTLTCTGGETATASDQMPGYTLPGSSGSATFTDCTIDQASSLNYVLVGAASLSDGSGDPLLTKSAEFAVTSGQASQLVFTTTPTGAQAGMPFSTQPVVAIEDSAGNIVSSAAGTVSLSITSTTGASGAALSSCNAVATTNGLATFSGCTIDKAGTGYTLTASATVGGSPLSGSSDAFIVSNSGAAALSFKTQPGDGTGGSPLSPQPAVMIVDGGGNAVSGSVQLALRTPQDQPTNAKLTCDANPAPGGTGTARFTGCAVDKAGTYILAATDPAASGLRVVSNQFTVTTGPAAQVLFTTSPSGAVGGSAFTTQPVVSVEDLGGNPVPSSTIDLSITTGTGADGAALSCSGGNSVNAASGTATFSGCSIDKAGNNYRLTAKSPGFTAKSSQFQVLTGAPAGLAFSMQPSGGIAGSPLAGQPQVTVTDAGGNPLADSGVSVSLSISGGTLTCLANSVSTNVSGIAVFSGCVASDQGTFTLHASASGLNGADSATFTLSGGSPLGVAPVGLPLAQSFGGNTLGRNPTSVADDVNTATGSLQFKRSDLKVAAAGEPFTLDRQYNSADTTGGAFGPGWSSIFDAGVKVSSDGQTATVRSVDGQQLVFTNNGNGGWNAPPGAQASLSCVGALCTVTRFDGVTFQSVGGRIKDYLSADGIGLHFIYAGGRLVQVTGSARALLSGTAASLGEDVGSLGWANQSNPVSVTLNAVDAVNSSQVWAVGNNCTLEFTSNGGATWTQDTNVTGCSGSNLTGVFVTGPTGAGWTVGTGGTLLVCASNCNTASAAWTQLTASTGTLPPSSLNFTSVWAKDTNDVWAVGTTTTGSGQIWACSSKCTSAGSGSRATWTNVTPSGLGSVTLNSVTGQGTSLVTAAGSNGTILLCATSTCSSSAGGWNKLTQGSGGNLPSSSVTFNSIVAADPSHVYAVGSTTNNAGVMWACSANCSQTTTGPASVPSPPPSTLPSTTGAAWADITPPTLGAALTSVTAQGAGKAWATGSNGQIWYCPVNCATEPTGWVALAAPWNTAGALAGVSSYTSNYAWVVGAKGLIQATSTGSSSPNASTLSTLDQAITSLGVALNPKLWVDDNHLNTSQGNQVLTSAVQAVQQLVTIIDPNTSSNPGWDATALLDLSQGLRIIDANAISENMTNPSSASALSSAQSQYTSADSSLASGRYSSAASAYQNTWQQAIAAKGSGQGSHTPLMVSVTENGNGEVTQVKSPTRTVSYGYSGTTLTGFMDAQENKVNGSPWTYNYGSTGSGSALTQEIDPTGTVRLSVSYSGGRISSASALGSQNHFADTYSWDPSTYSATRLESVQLSSGASTTTAMYVDQYKNNVLIAQQFPNGATDAYSYDSQLEMIEAQDPLGRLTQMTYNSGGDLIKQIAAANTNDASITSMTFNGSHQLTSLTDPNGNTTTFSYSRGNLVQSSPPGPAAGATTSIYNYLGEKIEEDGPASIKTFAYDDAGNQSGYRVFDLSHHALDGLGPAYTYNEAGEKVVSTDPRGHNANGLDPNYQRVDSYNANGNLTSTATSGPQGPKTTTAYNAAGDVTSVTDPSGATTTYTWHESQLTLTATGPDGKTTSVFDPSGNLLSKTDPGGRTTTYTYDTTGRQASVTDPANITTRYTYDLGDNILATKDSAGNSSSFRFDGQSRPITSTINGVTTSTSYDPSGNITKQTDAAGRVITYTYNSHQLVASATTAAGTTTYSYDLADALTGVTDGNGHTITYQVNGLGKRTAMSVESNVTTYGYDVAGNLISITDPDGRTTRYTLTAENLRTEINYSQSGQPTIDITQSFNALGERTSMTDPTGTHSYTYDASGNLTKVTDGSGNTVFQYDYTSTPGSLIETYPDGSKVTYAYDDAHNVMSVSMGGTPVVSYVRNTARQVTGVAYGNGVLQTESYNAAGQQTGYSLVCGGTTELTSATSFDAAGDPLGQATTAGNTTTMNQYGYDSSGRVSAQSSTSNSATNATTPNPSPSCTTGTPAAAGLPHGNDNSGTTTNFTPPSIADQPSGSSDSAPSTGTNANPIGYDAVGNQTSVGGTTISYNAADEVTGGSYTYDKAGNVISTTVGGVTTNYSYNAANQLATVTKGSTTVSYTYDGDGNRASRTVKDSSGTSVTKFFWDPSAKVPLLALELDGSGNLIARFIYGVGPVAMQTPSGTVYLHTDQLGNVTALSDNKGAVIETYSYDAFGHVTATQTGASAAPTEPLLFQGQYLDSATDLYDMRARNYDPATGRFTQRDPVTPAIGAPVFSPYVFANDLPTANLDPSGMLTASGVQDAVENGHSTESANQINGTKYDLLVAKVGFAPTLKIAAGTLGANTGELSEVDLLGKGAGRLAGVAMIGLATYVTVEDCEHGTVSQCVGDSVGVAISLGCLAVTDGVGAFACGLAGAGLSYAISHYGPQIVEGLADLGGYEIEGFADAITYTAAGFAEAGAVLKGAFATAASQTLSGLVTAGQYTAWVSTYSYSVVAGALSTGFNELAPIVSNGFTNAITTLEQAGLDAAEMASILKNDFNEGLNTCVNELINLGYDADGVAMALENVFSQTPQLAAAVLKGFTYSYDQIASGLRTAYNEAAADTALILQQLGAGISDISTALNDVYSEAAADAAAILKGLNYTYNQIAGALDAVFAQSDREVAVILRDLNYSYDEIASALQSVYQDADTEVAIVFNQIGASASQIASTLQAVFHDSAQEVAGILKNNLNLGINTIASALQTAYGETAQQVAGVLKDLGYSASEIKGVLTDVYHESVSAIEGVLSDVGFSKSTINAIGGAFSSFGSDLSSAGNTIKHWFHL